MITYCSCKFHITTKFSGVEYALFSVFIQKCETSKYQINFLQLQKSWERILPQIFLQKIPAAYARMGTYSVKYGRPADLQAFLIIDFALPSKVWKRPRLHSKSMAGNEKPWQFFHSFSILSLFIWIPLPMVVSLTCSLCDSFATTLALCTIESLWAQTVNTKTCTPLYKTIWFPCCPP